MTRFMRVGIQRLRSHRRAASDEASRRHGSTAAGPGRCGAAFEHSCFGSSFDLLQGLDVQELATLPDDWSLPPPTAWQPPPCSPQR